ncbi:heme-copper oxidase subunit III [Horticoccus luteus]|uniref:Cytochrome bo(3) ubiquinol oxidase subunit 3 n=1 Tax=Horticoccus luteus TaxID=2862869 RepID=A0A8F9TVP4_9BACT|nr:heme-copper oxidase subunit III [Horticoccus luteus]QYM79981.1 heme-copper oxidase subunit III [Horticoccus luteus]
MSSPAATVAIDHHHDHTTSTGIPNKKLLLWAFLASDCMFFGTLISTHLIYRLHPVPGGPDPRHIFSIELTSFSTFILLMSSLMMALAVNAIQKGNVRSMRASLLTTAFFGAIFVGCQVYEFHHFVMEKHLTISNSLFGSTFYTLTGTHGIHVSIGILWLMSMYFFSFKKGFSERNAVDVDSMGLYWHFVDIVWIVIFTAVYLLEFI